MNLNFDIGFRGPAGALSSGDCALLEKAVGDSGQLLQDVAGLDLNVRVPLNLQPYTVNGVLALTKTAGSVVYCTNGDAGQPCLAVCDGTNWRRVSLGAALSELPYRVAAPVVAMIRKLMRAEAQP